MRKTTARIPVVTKCLSCGQQVTESLGWFSKNPEPTCPSCGGSLDLQPLREMASAAAKRLKAAVELRNVGVDLVKKTR